MRAPGDRRGFTLLELAVTLAVVAIAAAVVLPRVPHGGALRVRSAADDLAARLSAARVRAILHGRAERVTLAATLPADVRVDAVHVGGTPRRPSVPVELAGDGDALPVRVTLAGDGDARADVVLPAGLASARVETP
jgi:prepilin-type N-terminal cleavage/methylation domain-containing protein